MADMICPNAKECEYRSNIQGIPEDEGRYFAPSYWHCDEHPYNPSCDRHIAHGKYHCPACIPSPSPTEPATQRQVSKDCDTIKAMRDALRWCSGSADFQEGGQARKGWLKICKPLL